MLAPLESLERGAIAAVRPELLPFFRDVHDHLRLVNEEVAAQRDLLTTVLEANMAVISVEQMRISVRQTDAMKQLTVIATVFLPLSFIVAFFGQNFAWLNRQTDSFATFAGLGGGGLLLAGLVLFTFLRRSRVI